MPGRLPPNSLLVALTLAVAGCGRDLTAPPDAPAMRPGPLITVSASKLSWTTDSVVRYRIMNPDSVAIYWVCPLEGLQYYRNGWRTTAWGQDAGCVANGPWLGPLAIGDSITVTHPLTNDLVPQAGWYRFVFQLYRAPAVDALWDASSRVSPAFFVGP